MNQREKKLLVTNDDDDDDEDDLLKTWIRTTVWPLERRFSIVHFNAFWLPLSLSTATATNPFPSPPFLLHCPFESHIFCVVSQHSRKKRVEKDRKNIFTKVDNNSYSHLQKTT
jgi:hypothetical protein